MATTADYMDRFTRDLARYLQHQREAAPMGSDIRRVVSGMSRTMFYALADDALEAAAGDVSEDASSAALQRWGGATYGAAADFAAWWVAEDEADDLEHDAD
jgi:hypothetical protein